MPVPQSRLLALLAGTAAFVVLSTAAFAPRFAGGERRHWAGSALQAVGVEARIHDGRLRLPASAGPVRWVLTTGPVSLDSAGAALVWLDLPGLHAATGVRLFWRTAEAPGTFHSIPVDATAGGRAVLSPAGHEGWSGRIQELGVLLTGPVPRPLEIRDLAAGPLTARAFWPTVWAQWLTFRPWRQASINAVSLVPRGILFPVVPAAALWVVLVLAGGRLLGGRGSGSDAAWVLGVFLAAWLALDLRWQAELGFRLQDTRVSYAGKSVDEKYLAGPDAALYRLSQSVRALAGREARVFVVSDEDPRVREYRRRRLHYFLLPANVYSEAPLPPAPAQLRPGDLMVVLSPHGGLRFDAQRGELRWGEESRIGARRLLTGPEGDVYDVLPGDGVP